MDSKLKLLLALCGAFLLALIPGVARSSGGSERLPDLVADPPDKPLVGVYDFGDGSKRQLLRFDGYIHNRGAGAAEIHGSNASAGVMSTVEQRVFDTLGGFADEPMNGATIKYETADGHNHWHLMNAARYSLWNAGMTAEVAPSMKVGFCLGDTEHVDPYGPSATVYTIGNFCQAGRPNATSVSEGISSGWRDRYPRSLAFQWVDISDVQPGSYRLAGAVDSTGVLRESDESNNGEVFGKESAVVPGFVAQPKAVGPIPNDRARKITLGAQTFGAPGNALYTVESLPQHGTLDRAVGSVSSDPVVSYTPDPGYEGADSFDFSVRSASSAYPQHPASASVQVSVATLSPSVAISGAPSQMTAGTAVQLTASVTDDAPNVSWSASAGTIGAGGQFAAPASPPAGGLATVAAETESGARDEVQIAIAAAPDAQPAPLIEGAGAGGRALGKPSYVRHGRVLLVDVAAGRDGVVSLRLSKRGRRLGSCRARLAAGRHLTCKIRLRRGQRARGARLVATIAVGGKLIATTRAQVEPGSGLTAAAAAQWICDLNGRKPSQRARPLTARARAD